MTLSMFDQFLFRLSCGHDVVLGRLDGKDTWRCDEEGCGKVTDLRTEPFSTLLAKERDTADQIDKQARQRGETVRRADD